MIAVVVAILVAGGYAAWFYNQLGSYAHEQITPDVWAISGFGGNVGVLRTDAGTVLVDSMAFTMQGKRLRELAEELTGRPVIAVISTHYHLDHTHGNPGMSADMRFISSTSTRKHLLTTEPDFWEEHAAFLPQELIDDDRTLEFGNKTIRVLHPGRGHTDGDLIIVFTDDGVVHVGDLMFNGRYPNIDLEAGGSVREWPATLDRIAELEYDHVIPGHGPPTDREGLAGFRAFVAELAEVGQRARSEGWSLEETLEKVTLTGNTGMEDFTIPFVVHFDHDFVVKRAWEEAAGAIVTRGD